MISEFKNKFFFLSNFYPSPVLVKAIQFPTAEHAFQAIKAKYADDMIWVASAPTPGKAKYRGRSIELREDWESIKLHEMMSILEVKFSDNDLMSKLKGTEHRPLVEGNYWHDQFWGNCLCNQHKDIPGQNYLGKILMYLRAFGG